MYKNVLEYTISHFQTKQLKTFSAEEAYPFPHRSTSFIAKPHNDTTPTSAPPQWKSWPRLLG